jgi:hypothetical protein
MKLIAYETLLDAARQHFTTVAASPNYTREARNVALELSRDAAEELDAFNAGRPRRVLKLASFVQPSRNDEEDHGVFANAA